MVINSITVKESTEVILLGITTDYKLVFKKHIENVGHRNRITPCFNTH